MKALLTVFTLTLLINSTAYAKVYRIVSCTEKGCSVVLISTPEVKK